VWAGAPANKWSELLAAVQVAVGNRRPTARVRARAEAVVHGDVTIHSNVRLSK
jgi:hypothetical protein